MEVLTLIITGALVAQELYYLIMCEAVEQDLPFSTLEDLAMFSSLQGTPLKVLLQLHI
ncbi:MAG: hypothetical protein R2771_00150 [Saprospiraceae bacterium]